MTTRDRRREPGAVHSSDERRDAQAVDEASGIGRKSEARLRFAVRAVDRQISVLKVQTVDEPHAAAVGRLVLTWAALVDQLALGPAPDVRSCPRCGRLGMSAATLCGYCWAPLSPTTRQPT